MAYRKQVSIIVKAEVEVWNPLTDLTPIHTWLHPWLPPLGNRLEIVYPPIRNKLAAALASWHPGTKIPFYSIKQDINFVIVHFFYSCFK